MKVTTVSKGTTDDAVACINAADAAFDGWAALSPRERGEILRKAYELFIKQSMILLNLSLWKTVPVWMQ